MSSDRAPAIGRSPPHVIVRADRVEKIYSIGAQSVRALDGASLTIDAGEFVAIMGPSGSGKSTMMNLIGGLDVPTRGTMEVLGQNLADLAPDDLAELRNAGLGFVFQQFNLLARTTALQQVMLPLSYARRRVTNPIEKAQACLEAVRLADRMDHLPSQLSGGQQQRVAIARALVRDPQIILADEPTGALDSKTSHEIMQLLCELNAKGITIVLVTHDADVAAYARRLVAFKDGRIIADEPTNQVGTDVMDEAAA